MKNLTLQLQDAVLDCLLDLIEKNPSSELEQQHKTQFGWSDETYQKILALRQSITDIGAKVAEKKVTTGEMVTSLSLFNTKYDSAPHKEKLENAVLKMCNRIGIRFSHLELKKRKEKDFPFDVIAHFYDAITPQQKAELHSMIYGYVLS